MVDTWGRLLYDWTGGQEIYRHWSTKLLASWGLLIIGAMIPQAPASSALEMRAVELSQTRTMGKQSGNFSSLWTHSNAVLSSSRPCCWSIKTAPKPSLAYCSVTRRRRLLVGGVKILSLGL